MLQSVIVNPDLNYTFFLLWIHTFFFKCDTIFYLMRIWTSSFSNPKTVHLGQTYSPSSGTQKYFNINYLLKVIFTFVPSLLKSPTTPTKTLGILFCLFCYCSTIWILVLFAKTCPKGWLTHKTHGNILDQRMFHSWLFHV